MLYWPFSRGQSHSVDVNHCEPLNLVECIVWLEPRTFRFILKKNYQKNYQLLEKKHDKYRGYLEERRDRKWKKFKEKNKTNPLKVWYQQKESASSFQIISEKEKTTNKEKELQELSALKSVAEKPNSSLVPQIKCDSNFIDNELSNRDVERPLNP